jgi:hypothetical protein
MRKSRIIMVLSFALILILKFDYDNVSADENKLLLYNPEKIIDMTCGYLEVNNFSNDDRYAISQGFNVLNDRNINFTLFFIFKNNDCIGELLYNCDDGSSAFFQEKCNTISSLYLNNQDVKVVFEKDNLYLITDSRMFILWGMDTTELTDITNKRLDYETIVLESFSYYTSDMFEKLNNRSSGYLAVPHVDNGNAPDNNGEGLCWLASSLSVIDYKKGTTGHTIYSLYSALEILYPVMFYGYPEGNPDWYGRVFSLFGLSLSYNESGMYFSDVALSIDNYNPIIASLSDSSNSSFHAVVIRGYSSATQTGYNYYYYYSLMDSNCSNYVTVSVSSTSTDFTYLGYSIWRRNYIAY